MCFILDVNESECSMKWRVSSYIFTVSDVIQYFMLDVRVLRISGEG